MSMALTSIASWSITLVLGLQHLEIYVAAFSILILLSGVFTIAVLKHKALQDVLESAKSFGRFFYTTFLKPHTGDSNRGQQAALESFYKAQVCWSLYSASNC